MKPELLKRRIHNLEKIPYVLEIIAAASDTCHYRLYASVNYNHGQPLDIGQCTLEQMGDHFGYELGTWVRDGILFPCQATVNAVLGQNKPKGICIEYDDNEEMLRMEAISCYIYHHNNLTVQIKK